MLIILASLLVDEDMLKKANGDEDCDFSIPENFDLALFGEMGKMVLSGIALEDYKIIINSRNELYNYTGNKGVRLKKYEPNNVKNLELINLSKNEE